MFQLFRSLSRQQLVLRQLPAFLVSFVIAALFYKFGSFAIECLAFLATWALVDFAIGLLLRDNARPESDRSAANSRIRS